MPRETLRVWLSCRFCWALSWWSIIIHVSTRPVSLLLPPKLMNWTPCPTRLMGCESLSQHKAMEMDHNCSSFLSSKEEPGLLPNSSLHLLYPLSWHHGWWQGNPGVRQQEYLELETEIVLGDAVQLYPHCLAGKMRVSLTLRREQHRTKARLSSSLTFLLSYILTPPLVCNFIPYPSYSLTCLPGEPQFSMSIFPLCLLTSKSTFPWWLLP